MFDLVYAGFASADMHHGDSMFIPMASLGYAAVFVESYSASVTIAGALHSLQQQPFPSGAGAEAG